MTPSIFLDWSKNLDLSKDLNQEIFDDLTSNCSNIFYLNRESEGLDGIVRPRTMGRPNSSLGGPRTKTTFSGSDVP